MQLWRRVVVGMVGTLTWLFARVTRTEIVGGDRLRALTLAPRGRGLLTICNHTSPIDDPFLWGALLPLRVPLLRPDLMRWTLGAEDVVFKFERLRSAFVNGQVISVMRGKGIWQPGMEQTVELLRGNEWVHIFPEAYVNQTGVMRPLRWGAARLVMEGGCPIVLPIWHLGMEHVLPEKTLQIPRPFKKVRIVVGEPIDFAALLKHHASIASSNEAVRGHIMEVLTAAMLELQRTATHAGSTWDTPLPVPVQVREHPIETGFRPHL